MIEYVEIRAKADRELIGIIDDFQSVIWHSVYFGVGDFEIYTSATDKNLLLLAEGNYITRPDDIEVGIIEKIEIANDPQSGKMISATGRFAKSILDRRHIYNLSGTVNSPTILRGNVETNIRNIVRNNAISCAFDSRRNIPILALSPAAGLSAIIVDESGNAAEKQVSFQNLLEYTDEVLTEYGYASIITLDETTKKLLFSCYAGTDRSVDNVSGNDAVIFSPEFDNLVESTYTLDKATEKTAALIGGEGEGYDRFYSVIKGNTSGLDRRETWVDASSLSKTYKEGETEKTYTDEEYKKLLDIQGKQTLLTLPKVETFSGVLDNDTLGVWRLNEDYALGDIVTVEDKDIGKYINVRITEITEVQDENGYACEASFEN